MIMTKVLIIDDDPDVRTVMDILLKKQGYNVETASKKDEAWDKLRNFQPSVVLLDVLLSGTDGRNLCQEIKANEQMRHIPVIMLSAHPSAAENITSYGADDFISKPLNQQILLEKISQRVNGHKK